MIKYVKQLDSIRAIAVLMVIFSHWTQAFGIFTENRLGAIGLFGVDIFFVLSGFLISSILFQNKIEAGSDNSLKLVGLKNFYIRRALRIFPVFYSTVFILVILKPIIPAINLTQLAYAATYTINFYFYHFKIWGEFTGHFWSLAVEEQFYLVWPLLVLLINRKYLPYAILFFIFIGIVSRINEDVDFGFLVTNTSFDAFGSGAMLAFIFKFKPAFLKKFFLIVSVLLGLAITGLAIIFFRDMPYILPQRTLNSIIALWLITFIIYKRTAGNNYSFGILDNRYLISIGKISYGMYVYHLFIPMITGYLAQKIFGMQEDFQFSISRYLAFFVSDIIILLFISKVSWNLMEKPVLRLKVYFMNKKTPDISTS